MPNWGSAAQFNKVPALGIVPEKNATAPANPVSGQLWTDTSVTPNKLRWYDGTTWIAADGTSIPNGYITDTHISGSAAIALSKLAVNPLARANHTGTQLAATISDFDTQVRTTRLDQHAVPTGPVDFNGQRGTNVASPIAANDIANRAYVDNARAGLAGVKDPVRVVTSTVTLATPGATIDGVTMVNGDRFLYAGTGTDRGIYTWTGAGTAATRTTDADGIGEIGDGTMVAVSEGTFAGFQYIQTATPAGAPGAWSQTWTVFTTGGQTYTAGTGLTLTGTQFALTSPVAVANGGTGATTAAAARTNLGTPGIYAVTLPALTAGSASTITHNLGTLDIIAVTLRNTSDGKKIDIDWAPTSTTAVAIYPDLAYAAGALRAVVSG